MARDKQPFEALSENAEKAFEQNMQKTRGAMDNYLRFLQNVWSPDLAEKMNTYTAQNISASTDCDNDTILFRVEVEGDGLVCHEGTVSCFTRPIDLKSEGASLEASNG